MRRAELVLVLGLLAACGGGTPSPRAAPRRAAPAPATAPAASASASAAADAEPALDPRLEALLAQREAFFATAGTAGATAQTPPSRPRPALPAKGVVPTKRVARIEAVAFNRTHGKGPRCEVADEPYARDGRLCEDVRLPIAQLSADETARVTALLDAAEADWRDTLAGKRTIKRAVTRCGFDPHHALVLYDAAERPIGTIVVCFSCREWLVRPASAAIGDGQPLVMDLDQEATLQAILDGHGLGASLFRDEVTQALWDYVGRVYGSASEPTPRGEARRRAHLATSSSGVPKEKRASSLDVPEREALCRWVTEEVVPARRWRRDGAAHGYACDDGVEWLVDYGEKECATRPLPCDRPVGDLEACLRELTEPDHLCGKPPPACAGLLTCLPGFRQKR